MILWQSIGRKITGKCRNVLVQFINRKHVYLCIKNGKKLKFSNNQKYKRYYISENLCTENRQIFNKLYKLKKLGEIYSVWSYFMLM